MDLNFKISRIMILIFFFSACGGSGGESGHESDVIFSFVISSAASGELFLSDTASIIDRDTLNISKNTNEITGRDEVAVRTDTMRDISNVTKINNDLIMFGVGDDGKIIRTTDGGDSWAELTSRTDKRLNGVHLDPFENFAVAVGEDGTIVRTTDLLNFFVVSLEEQDKDLNSVSFYPGSENGFAAGEDGLVLESSDGGINWYTSRSTNEDISEDLNSVVALRTYAAFAVGDNGLITWKLEGGSWNSIRLANRKDLMTVDYDLLSETIWFASEDSLIYKTDFDSLEQFIDPTTLRPKLTVIELADVGTIYEIMAVEEISERGNILVGTSEKTRFFFTQDGGHSWDYETDEGNWDIKAIGQSYNQEDHSAEILFEDMELKFYENRDLEGSVTCQVDGDLWESWDSIELDLTVNISLPFGCTKNDAISSMELIKVPQGTIIRVYDNSNCDTSDDWTTIEVKQDSRRIKINTFERDFSNSNVSIDYKTNGNLDGKISCIYIQRP